MIEPTIGIVSYDPVSAEKCAQVIERSRGRSRLIDVNAGRSSVEVLRQIDGLLVCGDHTNAVNSAGGPEPGSSREEEALALVTLEGALKADMPVLGISWGMHALNQATGGECGLAVSGHDSAGAESSYHRIFISPGSKLAAVVGSGGFVRVNSRHALGVSEAKRSPLLMTSAYSLEDGVVEAVESTAHRWAIGVQFQPERRREVPPHFDRLFQALVSRASPS